MGEGSLIWSNSSGCVQALKRQVPGPNWAVWDMWAASCHMPRHFIVTPHNSWFAFITKLQLEMCRRN